MALSFTKSDFDAQEVLQDSYIKAFSNLNSLQDNSKFEAWMTRIVSNTAINHMKKASNKYNVHFSDLASSTGEEELEFDTADEKIDHQPEKQFSKKETERIVKEILYSLSDEQRIAVMMYFYDSMTTKEIAQELGCNESTVKARIKYAKEKIKEQVITIQKRDDIKLYNLAPIPFFIWLMHGYAASGVLTGVAVTTTAGATATVTTTAVASTSAASTAATTSTIVAAKSVGMSVAAKVAIAAAVATGTIGGATATAVYLDKEANKPEHITLEYNVDVLEKYFAPAIEEKYPDGGYTIVIKDANDNTIEGLPSLNTEYKVSLVDATSGKEVKGGSDYITFIDTTPPEIFENTLTSFLWTGVYEDEDGQEVDHSETGLTGAWAKDNYDTDLKYEIGSIQTDSRSHVTFTLRVTDSSGNYAELATSADVRPKDENATYISYTVSPDVAAVQIIPDTEGPVIKIDDVWTYPASLTPDNFTYTYQCYDTYDNEQKEMNIDGSFYYNKAGTYPMVAWAVDRAGNETRKEFSIVIEGNAQPAPKVNTSGPTTSNTGFDESNPVVATALSLVGRSDLLCDQVVQLCLDSIGKNFYDRTAISGPEQPGDFIVFYSSQDFGGGSEHNSTWGYHTALYIGNGQCINGNYAGSTRITGCSSAKAEWQQWYRPN